MRATLATLLLGIVSISIAYVLLAGDLPEVDTIRDVRLQVPLRVYSQDGLLISVFGEKRRIPIAIEDMPEALKNAFIAGEDARFYEHPGVDYQGISRAVWTLATTGEKSVGGSTITQMLARNYYLSFEKTFTRKFKEIFLALRIERQLGKDEILELFLNKIMLGHRAYGVGAAADVYYGKSLDELTLAQCAMIAALPKAPSRINPITAPKRAVERRDYVLGRMLDQGYISPDQYQAAISERDIAAYHGATTELSAPYLAEMVRREALQRLGEDAYTGGYVIQTTLNSRMQAAANVAVREGLEDYDRRHGYRGAEAQVDLPATPSPETWQELLAPFRPVAGLIPGLVTEADAELAVVFLSDGQTIALMREDVEWARPFVTRDRLGRQPEAVDQVLTPGDVIRVRLQDDGGWRLGQLPEAEASLVSLDPSDGAIRALVGGYDFNRSKFNRVVQSRRQPGSSFKPFLYSAALENGFTTASLINDAPIVFEDDELERTWKPENFSQKFFGPTRLREAMVHSRNLVSIRLLRDIGVAAAREHISAFGFDADELPANLSLALGSANLSALSIARGYATFANGGFLVAPYFIESIENSEGAPVYRADPARVCQDCAAPAASLGRDQAGGDPDRPAFRPMRIDEQGAQLEVVLPGQGGSDADPALAGPAQRVISEQNAYLVRSMMTDVIGRGTGTRAKALGRSDLAGKTGTTNDQRDAWFSGYNDELVTTVWVGFDNHEPLGRDEVGGRAALPIWISFMGQALEGIPDRPRTMPPGLSQARIDPETGLLAALDNPNAIVELFQAGRLPPMEDSTPGEAANAAQEEDPYELY
ncbi:MAG: PBP1A family penicillin-binding protein [Xanthomonadales bacterium]|nr:PBP1A family penicillin-binding protein [Xanthomonadales bacterium]NIN58717.1 PBP1A family penicillin-binding protein [Xanthomonadales bacterium]NIN73983.1 PBP1A family penicillin-binding protein [Xanthomonadales bacterium]NIO12898.1 PBP1A family penicillin-binding protein [Xanthomonadales bacterium]NIP11110.1 PBP1A family penicillin-binding protein [Xanthomonadales bacterium]